jgi:hypothetical protein
MMRRNDMTETKTSISNASSYAEIGEYWDVHDLDEHWEETHEVEFDVCLDGAGEPPPEVS